MSASYRAQEKIAVKEVDESLVQDLAENLSVSPVLARIMVARGLTTYETCEKFFNPRIEDLLDPFLFPQMETAVARITLALEKKEKIAVYGDYDVDGVTSTALLINVLRRCYADCMYYLPNRLTDGYGLSEDGIRSIADQKVSLIITVDCGVAACKEISLANELGIDVIITDHHEPKDEIPDAHAILNPKVPGCTYPQKTLAGVGVALKLCQALCKKLQLDDSYWLDFIELAAVGTAADIVPLFGENRIITSVGFKKMVYSNICGLRALIDEQGLGGREINTHHVVFQIAPCINAVGRLGDARRGVELLLTKDEAAGREWARQLVDANLERRTIHQRVESEAVGQVEHFFDQDAHFGIVVAEKNWHFGVVGIVASRLVEQFYRPSIVLSVEDDGLARGSGRSIKGFHLLQALEQCSEYLESFGGHAVAAGLTVKTENIEKFQKAFNQVAREMLSGDDLYPVVEADAEIAVSALTQKMLNTINRMQPFGPGNLRPVFVARNLDHRYTPRVVGTNHLKLCVTESGAAIDAIGFDFGDRLGLLQHCHNFSLAFTLDENFYNGRKSLQMKIKGVEV